MGFHLRRLQMLPLVMILAALPAMAQEHSFGLRYGELQFPGGEVLTQSLLLLRNDVDLRYTRDFATEDYNGGMWEAFYEWRRDSDAHFSMAISGGVYAESGMKTVRGIASVFDPRGSTPVVRNLDASVVNSLELAVYYVHVAPRYNFTTGKFRFWAGGGLGLWANLWREVVDATYTDIFSCAIGPGNTLIDCTGNLRFRESDGDRRTILPFTLAAGFHYQFRPHWSFHVEDRYLFSGDSNVSLFRTDADYGIDGNQILVGFSYTL